MFIFVYIYIYLQVQCHIWTFSLGCICIFEYNITHFRFVFTALADECSVGRISEGCFVRDETCSHPINVFYATTSIARQLAYVYTMEVVKLEKKVLV